MLCKVKNSFPHNTRPPYEITRPSLIEEHLLKIRLEGPQAKMSRDKIEDPSSIGKYVFLIVKCILDFDFLWVRMLRLEVCAVSFE